uniref:Apple domain-containing protein n=1 Tax=Coccolithus braarudii TaxID=221442 RepID=A0A7S0LR50_9EUKA|mmetsp:Transcript_6174/g.13429  ORF Transcript_6174/g.13429 Transcript_6174/m.13429 type:complete len:151 (+) Transcript_6174:2-454(+)
MPPPPPPPPPLPVAPPPPPPTKKAMDLHQQNIVASLAFAWQRAPAGPRGAKNPQEGACKTHRGDGDYDVITLPADAPSGANEIACRARCAEQAVCLAYEFSTFASHRRAYSRCELQRLTVTHAVPLVGHVCYIKITGALGRIGLRGQPPP